MTPRRFGETWRELRDWPGTTVVGVRAKAGDRRMCAWLIARVMDETVYIDTLASHTDRLESRPNDTVVFVCLSGARACNVSRAHYSLKSNMAQLEAFKQSLGFEPYSFPARLHLRWPVGPLLRTLRSRIYGRLRGDPPTPPRQSQSTPMNTEK